jgi:hypothetical protein
VTGFILPIKGLSSERPAYPNEKSGLTSAPRLPQAVQTKRFEHRQAILSVRFGEEAR